MVGTWKLAEMEPCALPEKVATGFTEAFDGLVGAHYIPVLYCGEQLVHGTNHMLICKQTLVTEHPVEHLVKVILCEPLPTDEEQNWKIVSIDEIV